MKVLITSPSLNEDENVSGIATLIRGVTARGGCEFAHFTAGRKDGEGFDLGWLATQARLPFSFFGRIKRERPDVVHINTSFEPRAIIRDLILVSVAKFAKRPVLLHVHGGRFLREDFTNSFLANRAEHLLKAVKKVIVLSEAEKQNLLKRTPGLDISILPNAVPIDEIPATKRGSGEKTIIFFGRIDTAKGLSEIVEAARTLTQQGFKFRFTCFGTGPDKDAFISEMSAVLGENFYYGGVATGTEKWNALAEADIFLLPSKFEGLPMAMLEAMAAGCVPVVSDVGSIPTVIEDGHNGFLVEPGNLTQIVGKLKVLLSENEIGWDELRENSRKTVRENFDFKDYIVNLEKIYSEVAGK
jgi:glycosyltransferase involved in cell wall biosynthesis